MGICVKKLFEFHIFSFFLVLNNYFIIYINCTLIADSNTKTDATQIRSHIEHVFYLVQTYNILVISL